MSKQHCNSQKERPQKGYSQKGRGSVLVATAMAATLTLGGVPAVALADTGANVAADAQSETAQAKSGNTTKTQVVYAKTSATGAQEGVYVVNQFEAASGTDASANDAGTYQSVKNLTDDQALSAAGTSSFSVSADEPFLYQGDLSAQTQLPWTVSVSYKLDGKSVSADELAGATGALEMALDIEPNDACAGDYSDNFLLQVSGSLDNNLASQIVADDATLAQSRGNTQMSYMVFPGKSGNYTITADVHDFTFSGWTIVGVPLSIALNIDDAEFSDATSSMDELEQAIKDIDEGASSLKDGASSLNTGADSLNTGAASMASGSKELASGTDALAAGTGKLSSGASEFSDKLGDFGSLGNQLVAGSGTYKSTLTSQASDFAAQAQTIDVATAKANYQTAMQNYVAAFSGAFAKAYAQTGGSQEKAQAAAAQATAQQQAAMENALTALVTAQATKSGNEAAAKALTGAADGYGDLDSSIAAYVSGAQQLAQASSGLVDASTQVDSAASALSSGAASLATGATTLASGADTLASGAAQLDEGAGKLADGTGQAAEKTNGLSQQMIDQVRDKLTDYLNPSFQLTDFVNGSDEVSSVQFVIKTDAIEVPDDSADDDTAAEPEKGFFEKLLALFGM